MVMVFNPFLVNFYIFCELRCPTSFFCLWKSSSPAVYWRDCSLPAEWTWHCCQKSIGHICMGLFLGFQLLLLFYVCNLVTVPPCFDYCSLVLSFEISWCESSTSVNFQDCFGYSSTPWISIWIWGSEMKKTHQFFIISFYISVVKNLSF